MDRRQQKSRAAILEAFEELLAQKNYGKITVQDIIDRADVGRTTFYAHFETKDALLQELCTQLFTHVLAVRPEAESTHDYSASAEDPRAAAGHILYHLKDKGEKIGRLLVGESSDVFQTCFRKYLEETVRRYFPSDLRKKNTRVPEEFLACHISGSFVNMVQWWIRRGMPESPEQLADWFIAVTEPIL